MKLKSKTGYLGEKISILPWQVAEQLAVDVNVKNVTEDGTWTSSFIWFGCHMFYYFYTHVVNKSIKVTDLLVFFKQDANNNKKNSQSRKPLI